MVCASPTKKILGHEPPMILSLHFYKDQTPFKATSKTHTHLERLSKKSVIIYSTYNAMY